MPTATDQPGRILLIKPSALGDVCRTAPVLASLARSWPEARIDWLVHEDFVDAVSGHPNLSAVVPFPRRRFGRWMRSPSVARELLEWTRGLRAAKYDLVLDCQGLSRSGFMTRATGAAHRIGDRRARELSWLAYTQRVETSGAVHEVDRMFMLVRACGAEVVPDMRLHVPDAAATSWRTGHGAVIAGTPAVALATTSRWASKAWPQAQWVELARHLLADGPEHLLLLGAPSERAEVEALRAAIDGPSDRVHNLAGRTSVGEMMAAIESCRLVVSNDSAALHMAVGLAHRGVRCVGLFGPTDPAKVGPYRMDDVVVRAPLPDNQPVNYRDRSLGDSIMRTIAVADVLEKIESVGASPGIDTP
ncbi:MAG: glycosyltransferase family 9 protein [Phycisphaerales bacterium]|nr:glycosyltransferase family 9 protein [Phycisphaerales bacterium]